MDIESLCKETNLVTETLAEKIPTVALREPDIENQDESCQNSVFGY